MNAEIFLDTNVLLYLLSGDAKKADRAEALLAEGGIVSVQVLNEFAAVALRKLQMTVAEIREVLETVRRLCGVRALDVDDHERALNLTERYGYSFYDSLILAAAASAGCKLLYSEDMQSGQRVAGLVIRNPFA